MREPTFEQANDASPSSLSQSPHSKRWIGYSIAAIVAGLSVIGWAAKDLAKKPELVLTQSATPLLRTFSLPATWKTDVVNTMQRFAEATTPEAKIQFILEGEKLLPAMRQYYAGSPSSDLKLANASWLVLTHSEADLERGVITVGTRKGAPDGGPLVAYFKYEQGNYLLDWESYIQEKERLLEKFARTPSDVAAPFRVLMRRAHAFGEQETKGIVLQLSNASAYDVPVKLVVPPEHPQFSEVETMLKKWDTRSLATIRLSWSKPSDQQPPKLVFEALHCWELARLVAPVPAETDLTPPFALASQ